MPPSFKDNTGREWHVELTIASVKRVRRLVGFDLLGDSLAEAMEKLARDPVLLVDVLFAAVQPEAEKAGVTDEQFGESLGGDSLEHATDAFMDALVLFCQNPRERRALGEAVAAARRHNQSRLDRIENAIAEGAFERAIEAATGRTSTASPA